ncbi:MAG: hemolysin family protein, partial [Anaerolineales bacterium]
GAAAALKLVDGIEGFIYALQVGTTLVGIFAGALGGESLKAWLSAAFVRLGLSASAADTLALVLVVGVITYLTLVLGELVPKRMALNDPERMASLMARPMRLFAGLIKPAVKFVGGSTDLVLKLLGVSAPADRTVTEDEIRALMRQGTAEGVIAEAEHEMVESVMELGDRLASALMTARPDVEWLDVEASPEELRQQIMNSPYSHFPVARGSLDELIGEVSAKDLLLREWRGEPFDLLACVRPPLYVPEIMPATSVLEALRSSGATMAIVIDEYGSVMGVLTLTDILEEIVGDIPAPEDEGEPQAVQREDGSWLVDGLLPIDDFCEALEIDTLPGQEQGVYQTVAGFVVMSLGRVPSVADSFESQGWRFEVMDMDGPRVDKVLVQRVEPEQTDDASEAAY